MLLIYEEFCRVVGTETIELGKSVTRNQTNVTEFYTESVYINVGE